MSWSFSASSDSPTDALLRFDERIKADAHVPEPMRLSLMLAAAHIEWPYTGDHVVTYSSSGHIAANGSGYASVSVGITAVPAALAPATADRSLD